MGYSKKGGFATSSETEKSYRECGEEFKKACRFYQISNRVNTEIGLKDYMIYWFEDVYSERIENTTRMVGAYTLYDLILPHMEQDIKLYMQTSLCVEPKVYYSESNKGNPKGNCNRHNRISWGGIIKAANIRTNVCFVIDKK